MRQASINKEKPYYFYFYFIIFFNKGGFFGFFSSVLYSTLLHLPPLRFHGFHCVGECWDRTPDSCDFCIDCQTL
jgi:hypothetical protein